MKLKAPEGACDTHIHCYDRAANSAPGAAMPGHFPPEAYREVQERLGLSRVIVVQPNAYREDNGVTLAAMKALGRGAKGVAVVSETVQDAELERLTKAGIVGQRFFNLPAGTMPFSRMDPIMARVHAFGWHANLQLDGRELTRYEAQIRRLPGKFVIDHNGKYLEPVSPEHESFIVLKKLLDTGRCWVKLSAPY
jgi:D-galactarolactone isomerase